MRYFFSIYLFLSFCIVSNGQGLIQGTITHQGEPLAFANVSIPSIPLVTTSDEKGHYKLENVPFGVHQLQVSIIGYAIEQQSVKLTTNQKERTMDFELREESLFLDQVVVTGTKTFKRQTQTPVIVNILDRKTLDDVQACNLSEGLKFQPGLRVETDCQTCNYTQLRMNGLGGSYSQILINGRPVFSPLTGLYGMEQIPANMIERIEVVRGGGSALYGSSAIGGTVNIITRIPKKSSYDLGFSSQLINGQAYDHMLSGNANISASKGNAGAAIFVNRRTREAYDHNGDNFSELPELRNNSFGANLFFQPNSNQKLELSLSSLQEYRYGGEMIEGAAHLAQQSEERTHYVYTSGLDYQINFNEDNSSFIAYFAAQRTDRDHFTGILPDEASEVEQYITNPPYGISETTTLQAGTQVNHRLNQFFGGSNVLTFGVEYLLDDVLDQIESYNYLIDQRTENIGFFAQSDWEITPDLNLLAGLRADHHNLLDRIIYSPRLSLLYKLKSATQFRLSWGTGFRAPQAFDTDLHIAFAGGGISRISLDPNLKEERSNSISASINYDHVTEHYVAGFTFEGFYTHLDHAFYLQPIGEDAFGERFEKQNGAGATVQGLTVEFRANYDRILQLETGFTLQSSLFDEAVDNIDGLEARREFLRTPNEYGYATLSYMPNGKFSAALNLVYTGSMELAHFAGSPELSQDEYVTSSPFTDVSFRLGYTIKVPNLDSGLELFGGIKNVTNAYQNDFDTGKNRDSNFVYGPAAPRTFYLGLKIKSL